MKRSGYIIVLGIFLSLGFSRNEMNINNLIQYGDKYFIENESIPFSGTIFDISKETGNKILEYRVFKGIKQGYYIQWYPNGSYKVKGSYSKGLMNGLWTFYYENGQKMCVGTFNNGDGTLDNLDGTGKNIPLDGLSGQWKVFYPDGNLQYVGNFIDGNQEGKAISYYKDGQIYQKENIKQGKYVGEQIGYYKDGEISYKLNFDKLTFYYINGIVKSEGNFIYNEDDGKYMYDGKWTYYNEDGTILIEQTYKDGEPIETKEY